MDWNLDLCCGRVWNCGHVFGHCSILLVSVFFRWCATPSLADPPLFLPTSLLIHCCTVCVPPTTCCFFSPHVRAAPSRRSTCSYPLIFDSLLYCLCSHYHVLIFSTFKLRQQTGYGLVRQSFVQF
jgi:hypothetical protein